MKNLTFLTLNDFTFNKVYKENPTFMDIVSIKELYDPIKRKWVTLKIPFGNIEEPLTISDIYELYKIGITEFQIEIIDNKNRTRNIDMVIDDFIK